MARDLLVGTTLAGFTLLDRVGEGGTATVYRADHPQHGAVAVKVLREKLRQDKTAVARFVREAGFGTRVQHTNVVRTIETGQSAEGLHYLVIEWAPGEILEGYAKRNAPLPCDEVSTIVLQIADAVHAAHASGIVHRDLKPENLMYDPATRNVKLLDFGIATATDVAPDDRLTRAGFFVGTLMYVARSIVRRSRHAGRRSIQPRDHRVFVAYRCSSVYREVTARNVHTVAVAAPNKS